MKKQLLAFGVQEAVQKPQTARGNEGFATGEQLEKASWDRLAQLKAIYLKQLGYDLQDASAASCCG
ncbi:MULTISPECIES: hypothetical protein [Rufibacter]|uniref:Uncharacterized protein n=1 Tax=Rufibacter quisquiliarum TaxID=1549639 RepID=A0A839GI56_9BACT|nr:MULTISPECIES: hypothetical protein [Rufibacter]MBA9075305.1 hypothetical protein [Rufibacter quisquiliarum]